MLLLYLVSAALLEYAIVYALTVHISHLCARSVDTSADA
jgi:hypothetical protein